MNRNIYIVLITVAGLTAVFLTSQIVMAIIFAELGRVIFYLFLTMLVVEAIVLLLIKFLADRNKNKWELYVCQ